MNTDMELRLVDPAKNRFRLYGITVCRTLFGELCLRIAWGRIGNRRMRERTETFADPPALERRRDELLARRRRRGYVVVLGTPLVMPAPRNVRGSGQPRRPRPETIRVSAESEIVEAHGMSLQDKVARKLVARWFVATCKLSEYLAELQPEVLDLVDVSTLAAMFVEAAAVAGMPLVPFFAAGANDPG